MNIKYSNLTDQVLEALFGQIETEDSCKIKLMTGKGGVYNFVRALNKVFNVKNPEIVTFKQLRVLFRDGIIKKIGGLYLIN